MPGMPNPADFRVGAKQAGLPWPEPWETRKEGFSQEEGYLAFSIMAPATGVSIFRAMNSL